MTTDEALAAVKKAVGFIRYLEARVDLSSRNPNRPFGETIEEILLAALRAIAPDGPLVCVPRRLPHQPRMDGHCDVCGCKLPEKNVAWAGEPNNRFYYCPDHWPKTLRRAMIAEGEKS